MTMDELMDNVPYNVLMMMNAVIPDYGSGSEASQDSAPARSMSLFEIGKALSEGKKI